MSFASSRISRPVAALADTLPLSLGLVACGSDTSTIEADPISVEIPSDWVDVSETDQAGSWEYAYTDSAEDPTVYVRISGDTELAMAADTSMAVLQGQGMFGAYGEGFSMENNEKWEIDSADWANHGDFVAEDPDGDPLTGHWWLASARSVGHTSGVELIGRNLDDELVQEIAESIEYRP